MPQIQEELITQEKTSEKMDVTLNGLHAFLTGDVISLKVKKLFQSVK